MALPHEKLSELKFYASSGDSTGAIAKHQQETFPVSLNIRMRKSSQVTMQPQEKLSEAKRSERGLETLNTPSHGGKSLQNRNHPSIVFAEMSDREKI